MEFDVVDESRIRDMERRLYDIEKRLATGDLSDQHTEEKFKELREELKSLKVGINRVLWSLGAVALGAIANFILQGGLNVPIG